VADAPLAALSSQKGALCVLALLRSCSVRQKVSVASPGKAIATLPAVAFVAPLADLSPSGKSLLRRPSSEGSPCCFRTQGT
jgi:hypothetical protein